MSDLETRFAEAAEAWQRHCIEVGAASNPQRYLEHESFERLVALGAPAVRLCVEAYRRTSPSEPMFWGAVLSRITGREDFGNGVTGNLKKTRAAWLAWADQTDEES